MDDEWTSQENNGKCVYRFIYLDSHVRELAYKLLNKNVPEMFLSVITTALRVVALVH